jgi:hypothetical protein
MLIAGLSGTASDGFLLLAAVLFLFWASWNGWCD